MKRLHITFSIFSVVLDYAMLLVAAYSAYAVRYMDLVQDVRPIIFDLPFLQYMSIAAVVAVVWIAMFALVGMYTVTYRQRAHEEISRVIVGCLLGFVAIITFLFWSRELFSSRFILLAALLFAMISVTLGRMLLRIVRRYLLKRDVGTTRVVIIGDDETTKALASIFFKQPVWGYKVVARFPFFDTKKAKQTLKQSPFDEIFLTDPSLDQETRLDVYDFCIEHHLGFRYTADMFDAQSHNVDIQTIGGVPIIEIKKTPLDGWGRVVKRLFDIVVSLVLAIILLPVFLLIGFAIKVDSPGPIIYKNKRVGKDGKVFTLYKFRRMLKEYCVKDDFDKKDAALQYEKELIKKSSARTGGLYKIMNDPRSTRVGRFIEKTSLDELPQLYNVLFGSMSLVGPRPHQPREVEQFPKRHERVMAIKPGITGLAQVSGRSDLDTEDELRLDVYYIENWSLKTDISLLFKTPFALLKRHKS
ncbi:MAG: sugar transferase [Patescibacteria group bacterium]